MRCLTFTAGTCDKWTMHSTVLPKGVLEGEGGKCLEFSAAQNKLVQGSLGTSSCAEFEYLHPAHELSLDRT